MYAISYAAMSKLLQLAVQQAITALSVLLTVRTGTDK